MNERKRPKIPRPGEPFDNLGKIFDYKEKLFRYLCSKK